MILFKGTIKEFREWVKLMSLLHRPEKIINIIQNRRI